MFIYNQILLLYFLLSIMEKSSELIEKPLKQEINSLEYFIDLQKSNFKHAIIFQKANKLQPWSVLSKINDYLNQYFKVCSQQRSGVQIVGNAYIDETDVEIGQGTVIEHGAMIKKPCIIGKNCEIRKGAYIRGNVIIGDNVIIGNSCQVKNSIVFNNCQIAHFNYIGDSILGTKSHMSAGAITSNYRLDGKTINVSFKQQTIKTDLIKFGAIIGDRSQIGCNVVLNPGSLISKDAWIYPNVSFRGFLQSNKILKLKQQHIVCEKRSQNNNQSQD